MAPTTQPDRMVYEKTQVVYDGTSWDEVFERSGEIRDGRQFVLFKTIEHGIKIMETMGVSLEQIGWMLAGGGFSMIAAERYKAELAEKEERDASL